MTPIKPACQTQDCQTKATVLLKSQKTGTELHLCRDCASRYHEHGWHKVTGPVELRTGTVNEHD